MPCLARAHWLLLKEKTLSTVYIYILYCLSYFKAKKQATIKLVKEMWMDGPNAENVE